MEAVPRDTAIELCQQVRQRLSGKLFSFWKWQCWGCVKFTKGEIEKMCLFNDGAFNGCGLVNKEWARRKKV